MLSTTWCLRIFIETYLEDAYSMSGTVLDLGVGKLMRVAHWASGSRFELVHTATVRPTGATDG